MLARLERINGLRRAGADPGRLLGELRLLVREGEAWAAAEGEAGSAARALAALEEALAAGPGRSRAREGVAVPGATV